MELKRVHLILIAVIGAFLLLFIGLLAWLIVIVKRRKSRKPVEESSTDTPDGASDAPDGGHDRSHDGSHDGSHNGSHDGSDDGSFIVRHDTDLYINPSFTPEQFYESIDEITEKLNKSLEKHERDDDSDKDSGHSTAESDLPVVETTGQTELSPDNIQDTLDRRYQRKQSVSSNKNVIVRVVETHPEHIYARPFRSTLRKNSDGSKTRDSSKKQVTFSDTIATIIVEVETLQDLGPDEDVPHVSAKSERLYDSD